YTPGWGVQDQGSHGGVTLTPGGSCGPAIERRALRVAPIGAATRGRSLVVTPLRSVEPGMARAVTRPHAGVAHEPLACSGGFEHRRSEREGGVVGRAPR